MYLVLCSCLRSLLYRCSFSPPQIQDSSSAQVTFPPSQEAVSRHRLRATLPGKRWEKSSGSRLSGFRSYLRGEATTRKVDKVSAAPYLIIDRLRSIEMAYSDLNGKSLTNERMPSESDWTFAPLCVEWKITSAFKRLLVKLDVDLLPVGVSIRPLMWIVIDLRLKLSNWTQLATAGSRERPPGHLILHRKCQQCL